MPERAREPSVAERIDLALRHAWAALAEDGRREEPSIVAVRVGELGVELLLDPPMAEAAGRFVASEGGHLWRLAPDLPDSDLYTAMRSQPAPRPALVTVGTTAEGPVLIDVRRARTLSVEGEAALVASFLADAALELASAPWAAELQLRLLGGDERRQGERPQQ